MMFSSLKRLSELQPRREKISEKSNSPVTGRSRLTYVLKNEELRAWNQSTNPHGLVICSWHSLEVSQKTDIRDFLSFFTQGPLNDIYMFREMIHG